MQGYVGRQHEFQDPDYVQEWAERFMPTPDRLRLFDIMIDRVRNCALPNRHVVELGIGPGYLADRLLTQLPDVTYEGVDFSKPMLELASQRLSCHYPRLILTHADLSSSDWSSNLKHPVAAFLSTWTLHELGGQKETARVYENCHDHLEKGGILLNGDFVKPVGTRRDFEPGRFPVKRHLEILLAAGFRQSECLVVLEKEIQNPSASQNYACLTAMA